MEEIQKIGETKNRNSKGRNRLILIIFNFDRVVTGVI